MTGDETDLDPGDLHKRVDLDAADLWVPLCSPLTRRKNPEWDTDSQYGSQYSGPNVVGTRALDVRRGDLVLRTCGSAAARVITRSPRWEGAFFAGTRASWLDQDRPAALFRRERGRARVGTFDLVTGRVRGAGRGEPERLHGPHPAACVRGQVVRRIHAPLRDRSHPIGGGSVERR